MRVIDLDAAREARAAEGTPEGPPATLLFDDPARLEREHPEVAAAAARSRAKLRELGRRVICEAPPERWEPAARPVICEAQAAYRRGGEEAAMLVIRRHHRAAPTHRAARAPRAASVRHVGSRRTSSSSRTSGTDPGDPDPDEDPPRQCSECGVDISHRRRGTLTCSGRCRQRRSLREREEAAAWQALADAEHPGPTELRPGLLPGQLDAEVEACWVEDTVGRVSHGRRRHLNHGGGHGYWPTQIVAEVVG